MGADINPEDESLLDDDGVVIPNNSNTNEKKDGNKSPKLPKPPSNPFLEEDKGKKRKAISSVEEYAN